MKILNRIFPRNIFHLSWFLLLILFHCALNICNIFYYIHYDVDRLLEKLPYESFIEDDELKAQMRIVKKEKSSIEKQIDEIIKEYQASIDKAIPLQTASWFRYLATYRADSTTEHVNEQKSNSTRYLLKRRKIRSTISREIQWDREEDIDAYFIKLSTDCEKMSSKCLLFLDSLVNEPRCTTRLDSRYFCNSKTSQELQQEQLLPIESILGPKHLSKDTLNVIIIGAGPVGLYMANALLELRQLALFPSDISPEIRIVIFENRISSKGEKKPYSRTWETAMPYEAVGDTIDPRIQSLFQSMFIDYIALPINFWETLLLLSNRDRGVKFIYDDIENYDHFIRDIPNLLLFDATGHRLQPLDRGEEKTLSDTQILTWGGTNAMKDTAARTWFFPVHWTKPLAIHKNEHRRSSLKIALSKSQYGSIIYPVLENNNPYHLHRFELCNIPNNKKLLKELNQILVKVHLEYVNVYGLSPPYLASPVSLWNDSKEDDLLDLIPNTKFVGYQVATLRMKLTPEQGMALEKILINYKQFGNNIPLSKFSIDFLEDEPSFQMNHIGEIITLLKNYNDKLKLRNENPGVWINSYQSRPYIYKDVLVKGGYLGKPLLRVGNSLLVGDTDIGTGLQSQFILVRQFQCRLLGDMSRPFCEREIYETEA